jgi:hypothetical protein
MKLKVLPSRDSQGIVGIFRCESIASHILIAGKGAAGKLGPNHHNVLPRHFALVAVVLLIDAVKLQELVIVIGKNDPLRRRPRWKQFPPANKGLFCLSPSLRVSFGGAVVSIISYIIRLLS